MTNIERAIKGLEICYYPSSKCENCPYHDLPDGQLCTNQLLRDVLTMLKEQEAKERCLKTKCVICPHCDHCDVDENGLLKEQEAEWIYGENETGADGWHCSYCGFFEPWFYKFTDDIDFIRFYSFCPSCGRKMTSYTGKSEQKVGEV